MALPTPTASHIRAAAQIWSADCGWRGSGLSPRKSASDGNDFGALTPRAASRPMCQVCQAWSLKRRSAARVLAANHATRSRGV